MIEMPAPMRRIFTMAEFAHARPIKDTFDPSTKARGGLSLGLPNRFENLQNHGGVNGGHRLRSEDRVGICRKGCCPLSRMLGIFPPSSMRFDIGCGTLLEGHCQASFGAGLGTFLALGIYGVDAIRSQASASSGLLARLRERDSGHRAEAHVA